MPKHLPFAELNQTLVFQNQVLAPVSEAKPELKQADKNEENGGEKCIKCISGGCPSKSSITIRMACGLQDEALQAAKAKREMCYFQAT